MPQPARHWKCLPACRVLGLGWCGTGSKREVIASRSRELHASGSTGNCGHYPGSADLDQIAQVRAHLKLVINPSWMGVAGAAVMFQPWLWCAREVVAA